MFLDRMKCPYCAASLNFARLPVVATNSANVRPRTVGRTAAGTDILDWIGNWPVIRRPAAEATGLRKVLRFVDADKILGPAGDLPAYVCLSCEYPLPNEMASREVCTIAVIGTVGAGKSHFLAAMAREASRRQGLVPFGITEFAPDEISGTTYHNKYHRRIFHEKKRLPPTHKEPGIKFEPLTFRVTAGGRDDNGSDPDDARRFLLMFHDVAGEMLTDRAERAVSAPFVRQADGVIFLIDPSALEPVSEWRARGGLPEAPDDFHQADLLRACLNDIGPERLHDMPVAITLSKSDMISTMLGRDFAFARESANDPARWLAERNYIDTEVMTLLRELEASDILAAARLAPQATFHAVAPIGSEPMPDASIPEVRPRRVLDPLAQILLSFMNP